MPIVSKTIKLARAAKAVTEFRIFRAGANGSTKGTFTFGPEEAAAVMALWEEEGGHRLPIDLEHDSLNTDARSARADAGDAMGWFTPELRNGELWATAVEWTEPGADRLARKTHSYFSPAFLSDEGRIKSLINVALCTMPALHDIPQLVAASKLGAKGSTVIGARVTLAQARAFRRRAAKVGVPPGVLLRLAALGLGAASEGNDTLTPLRELLGLDADADADTIRAAIDELLADADGEAADVPKGKPAKLLTEETTVGLEPEQLEQLQAAVDAIEAGDTAKAVGILESLLESVEHPDAENAAPTTLSKDQIAALNRRGLPTTHAAWIKLRNSMTRRNPARRAAAPAVVALSRAEIARQVAALSPDVRRAALAKGMTLEQFIEARSNAVRRV